MKKSFIISKVILEHDGTFYLKDTGSHKLWTVDINNASRYEKEADAERTLLSLPEETIANCFRIEPIFFKTRAIDTAKIRRKPPVFGLKKSAEKKHATANPRRKTGKMKPTKREKFLTTERLAIDRFETEPLATETLAIDN